MADKGQIEKHTIAVLVAGRLVSWGVPGVALVPALRLLAGADAMA